jgi:hypothetical protein
MENKQDSKLHVKVTKELLDLIPNGASYIVYVSGIEDAVGFSEVKPMDLKCKESILSSKDTYYLMPVNGIAVSAVEQYDKNINIKLAYSGCYNFNFAGGDFEKSTRLEVISNKKGREYVNTKIDGVYGISLQDDGKTIKIFIED